MPPPPPTIGWPMPPWFISPESFPEDKGGKGLCYGSPIGQNVAKTICLSVQTDRWTDRQTDTEWQEQVTWEGRKAERELVPTWIREKKIELERKTNKWIYKWKDGQKREEETLQPKLLELLKVLVLFKVPWTNFW
jgi:hypothetical protein